MAILASTPDNLQAKKLIEELDLSCVIFKLSHTPRITGWTKRDAKICAQQYKNYLFLLKKYPGKVIPPNKNIDDFWHEHILFTRKYHEDTLKIFGEYLHHQPGEPTKEKHIYLRSKNSPKYFEKTFDEVTQELYFLEFGEYL